MYEIQLEFSSVEKGFKPMNSLCGGEGKGGGLNLWGEGESIDIIIFLKHHISICRIELILH